MNTKILSFNLVRLLVILALVLPMALGANSLASATTTYNMIGWGYNGNGQISIPANLTDVVAIDAGFAHSLALKSDGTVVAWGSNSYGQSNVPTDLTGVIAISAGYYHNLALKGDGTVVAWGWNNYGQSTVPSELTNVVAIDAGEFHNLVLKSDGTLFGWGNNVYGQITIPSNLTDIAAFDAGFAHSLALNGNGTVVGWGYNNYGETNIPEGLTDVVDVAAGTNHSLALKSDGTVVAWGWNLYGQTNVPANLTGVVAISAGAHHNLALKSDGTVVGWGQNSLNEATPPSNLSNVAAIAAGGLHSLALFPVIVEIPSNTAPVADPGGPYLGAVNATISFDGSSSFDADGDPLNYAWTFGDGSNGSGAMPTHSYAYAGIFDVCLTVNDGSLDSSQACTLAVVYDPSNGFVTGGGWIDSPAGAYKADVGLAGKATFGFMSKYQKGASVPTGTTAFEFDLAGLSFASQSYEWLVVNQSGTNAQFKGSGLINGLADINDNAYKFMLWAGDGSPDTFHIRIWWEDADGGEQVVYDNGSNQAIGAGNIVIHSGK